MSEKYRHYFENHNGGDSYEDFLKQKFQIRFSTKPDFYQFYNSMKYYLKCFIVSEHLDPLHLFLNQKLVSCYSDKIETIKTSLTVDQIAILANLFLRDCAPDNDKAVLQRIISTIFIPKSGAEPVSLSSLKNKMKPDFSEYSDKSRKATRKLLEKWKNSPFIKSS